MPGDAAGSLMDGDGSQGVVFPLSADGKRSTSALGKAVVADALRLVDPPGARGAEQEANWRSGYLVHFRRLVEAGVASKAAALSVARYCSIAGPSGPFISASVGVSIKLLDPNSCNISTIRG